MSTDLGRGWGKRGSLNLDRIIRCLTKPGESQLRPSNTCQMRLWEWRKLLKPVCCALESHCTGSGFDRRWTSSLHSLSSMSARQEHVTDDYVQINLQKCTTIQKKGGNKIGRSWIISLFGSLKHFLDQFVWIFLFRGTQHLLASVEQKEHEVKFWGISKLHFSHLRDGIETPTLQMDVRLLTLPSQIHQRRMLVPPLLNLTLPNASCYPE